MFTCIRSCLHCDILFGCSLPTYLQFFDIIGDVEKEVEKFPAATPTPDTYDNQLATPFFLKENPFVSNGLIKLSTKHFRERDYDCFAGDPFAAFVEENQCNTEVSESVRSNPPIDLTTAHEDSPSRTPDSGVAASGSPPSVNLRQSSIHASSSSPTPQLSSISHSPRRSSPVDLRTQTSPTHNHGDDLSKSSYKHTSSNRSSHERDDQHGSPLSLASSQELLCSPSPQGRLLTGGGSQNDIDGQGSHLDLSQQSAGSCRQSRESLSSSPNLKNSRQSGRSSNASFQEVVIMERTEPILQVCLHVLAMFPG